MDPPQPPLPAARYFPFQPVSGIHTSIWISESMLGFSVAVTRQYEGRLVDFPASTDCASVMVVFGRSNPAMRSQAAVANALEWNVSANSIAAPAPLMTRKRFCWDTRILRKWGNEGTVPSVPSFFYLHTKFAASSVLPEP